jgi:hypothetical protein
MFLACWLEYHDTSPADRASFVARIYAEQLQRAREFGRAWRKRWYGDLKRDRLHEISIRESPMLARIRREQDRCEVIAHRLVPYPSGGLHP